MDKKKLRQSWKVKAYKKSDRIKNRQYDLELKWVRLNIFNKPCTYCGSTDNVGVDRINNHLGHTKTNVVPACALCNMIRNNKLSFEEMKILGKTIKKIRAKRHVFLIDNNLIENEEVICLMNY